MIQNLLPSDDPLLHTKIDKCSYDLDRQSLSLERAFVMISDMESLDTITCFNPKVLKESKKRVKLEEGCLSYPDIFLDVDRPESIIVKYEDEGKKLHKIRLEGFIARIFLHEYDHMEGIDFTQR